MGSKELMNLSTTTVAGRRCSKSIGCDSVLSKLVVGGAFCCSAHKSPHVLKMGVQLCVNGKLQKRRRGGSSEFCPLNSDDDDVILNAICSRAGTSLVHYWSCNNGRYIELAWIPKL